jgi:hypothetical protein
MSVPFCAKFVPVNVTLTACPMLPFGGLIDVTVGTAAPVTVNTAVPDVPSGVVTVTVRSPVAAVALIVSVANSALSLATCTAPAVTPVPDTLTTLFPCVKFVPCRTMLID